MKSKFFVAILLTALALTLAGCSIKFNSGGGNNQANLNDGGVYRTLNKGNGWEQKVLIPTVSGRPASIGAVDVYNLVFDPSDNQALYLGSIGEGLIYTYDGAETWQRAGGLGRTVIRSVAVDPASKCVIYAAVDNKLYKSTDCNRSWTQAYFDNDPRVTVNTIVINQENSANIYIGTSRGEIIKSSDRGVSWQTIYRFTDKVMKHIISPQDNQIMFVATERRGIYFSNDAGLSWASLKENLKDYHGGTDYKDMVFSNTTPGRIFLASQYGLLRSDDNGTTWNKIELITPEQKATINALAVNPQNDDEIYYTTNTTFYRSFDGGQSWNTKKLPTSRAGWVLLADPKNPNLIYLGARKLGK